MTVFPIKPLLSAVGVIVIIGVLVIGRDHIATFFNDDDKPHLSMAFLETEFKAIPLHRGDKIADFKKFDKDVIVGATAQIWSDAPASEILMYYAQALPPLGWVRSNAFSKQDDEIKFCKAGNSVVVQTNSRENRTFYYLGVVRTQYKASTSYCP